MELALRAKNLLSVLTIARVVSDFAQFIMEGHWGDSFTRVKELAQKALNLQRYQAPRHLRIFVTRTENYQEDVRRMREVIVLLSGVEGRDRFTLYVPNPTGMVQLDFPNHSTNYPQIAEALSELISDWGRVDVQ